MSNPGSNAADAASVHESPERRLSIPSESAFTSGAETGQSAGSPDHVYKPESSAAGLHMSVTDQTASMPPPAHTEIEGKRQGKQPEQYINSDSTGSVEVAVTGRNVGEFNNLGSPERRTSTQFHDVPEESRGVHSARLPSVEPESRESHSGYYQELPMGTQNNNNAGEGPSRSAGTLDQAHGDDSGTRTETYEPLEARRNVSASDSRLESDLPLTPPPAPPKDSERRGLTRNRGSSNASNSESRYGQAGGEDHSRGSDLDLHTAEPINNASSSRAVYQHPSPATDRGFLTPRPDAPTDFSSEVSSTRGTYHPSPTSSNQTILSWTSTEPPTQDPGVVLPRWQLDAEVTLCPICGTQFSFFIRKHHCRKCGRVVCNSCSPHRITIPYQFIVQPPSETPPPRTVSGIPTIDVPMSTNAPGIPGLGGGERVRLCNPCVPDPNIAPPQTPQPESHPRSAALSRPHNRSSSLAYTPREGSSQGGASPQQRGEAHLFGSVPYYNQTVPAQYSSRRSTVSAAASSSRLQQTHRGQAEEDQHPGGLPPAYEARADGTVTNITSPTPLSYAARVSHARRDAVRQQQALWEQQRHPSSSRRHPAQRWDPSLRPAPPAPPAPPLDEADICPVCHNALPTTSSHPSTPLAALREAHISACIAEAMSGPSSSSSLPASSLPASSGATPTGQRSPATPRRRTAVFPYRATEKDCVDDAECTVCLEEFAVGDEMGRLECFCRFHLACIRRWFEKRPGQCPVHQHDGGM